MPRNRCVWLALMSAAPLVAGNLPLPGSGRVAIEFNQSLISSVVVVGLAGPAGVGIASDPVSGLALRSCPMPGVAASLLQSAPFPAGVVPLFSTAGAQAGCRVLLDSDQGVAGIQEFAAVQTLTLVYCSMSSASATSCDLGTSAGAPSSYVENGTALHGGLYPNMILKWQLDDRANAGDPVGDNNDLVVTVRQKVYGFPLSARMPVDSDGDGLWDDWETQGADVDADGVIDVNLPYLGASFDEADLFLWIDYMDCAVPGSDCTTPSDHSHQPKEAALDRLELAFSKSDTSGTQNEGYPVRLHMEVAPSAVQHKLKASLAACGAAAPGAADFDAIKAASFGANPRRYTHRYALFAHGQTDTGGATGCAETPGNDLLVTLGNMAGPAGDLDGDGTIDDGKVGTIVQQAGTLMHELGHTLGLRHGGGDPLNYKPTYFSVMNYGYQLTGIPRQVTWPYGPSQVIDFSGGHSTINESALVNSNPVYNFSGYDVIRHVCPNFSARVVALNPGSTPIDWHCNNFTSPSSAAIGDVNGDRECVRPGADGIRQTALSGDDVTYLGAFIHDGPDRTCQSTATGDDVQMRPLGSVQAATLAPYNDWRNARLDFFATPGYPDGQHAGVEGGVELDVETYRTRLAPDPAVSVTAAPNGAGIVYTVRLTNQSTDTSRNVETSITIPAPLVAGTCTVTGPGACSGAGNTRTLTLTAMNGGGEPPVATIQASAPCTDASATLYTASASLTSLTPDIDLANNAASIGYPKCVARPYTVAVTYGAPRRNPTTGIYAQPVTVRNTGTQTATGPLSLVLNNLTPGVTLAGASSTVYAAPAGRPHVAVGVASLAAGASTTLILSFQNPANTSYGFTAQLLGPGAR